MPSRSAGAIIQSMAASTMTRSFSMISTTFSGMLPRPTWLAKKPIATGIAWPSPRSSMAAPGVMSPFAIEASVST
ncbi:MAG: hypothetical protein ACR2I1_05930 [Propionibacteriaceae bacterium]